MVVLKLILSIFWQKIIMTCFHARKTLFFYRIWDDFIDLIAMADNVKGIKETCTILGYADD
jgi:hypothetical protein